MAKRLALAFCVVAVSADVVREFFRRNDAFTSAVYREIRRSGEDNLVVSPFSAATALAPVQLGAKGPTRRELTSGLRLAEDEDLVKASFKSLIARLSSNRHGYVLKTANKIYINDNFVISDGFKRTASDVFQSNVENIDFSRREDAARVINDWVQEQTEDTIRDLVSSDSLNDVADLLSINAVYFKADWRTPFFSAFTKRADFFTTQNAKAEVLMMHEALTQFLFCENNELDAEFLVMPFEDDEATITFVLPNALEGLGRLESEIEKILLPQNCTLETVDVTIPKFKIESVIDFKTVLTNLGIRKAFTPGEADFSGISDKGLVLGDVRQKAFIDVNEEGVKAAAATNIRLVDYAGVDSPTKTFRADHPFLYVIKVKQLVLFIGRVGLPKY